MRETYDHLEAEPRIARQWEEKADFSPKIDPAKKPFSIFLTPPNASGPMHIGNTLMIAVQDILARYHRLQGRPTLWVPSIDHGGYETQILLEKQLEEQGHDRSSYKSWELFDMIYKFAQRNGEVITEEIKALGGSVDWTRFRFTLDEDAAAAAVGTFKKMVADNLIYRRPYMVHYCSSCATLLSDIELKEMEQESPLYYIKFPFSDGNGGLVLQTARPEFLFATTHVLVHPNDSRFSAHIGRQLINPSTSLPIKIVASKRKFDPTQPEPLQPFNPSFNKYDYTYTLRNDIPSKNLLDWEGRMIEHYPGLTPKEAREKEVQKLSNSSSIEKVDESHLEPVYFCKRGHAVENMILETWFLKVNDQKISLCQNALSAIKKEGLTVLPHWRADGLIEWIGKMPDWPIARQNVWGIKIPVWYEVDDPTKFRVSFINHEGDRLSGSLDEFLNAGHEIEEISAGLERLYADSGSTWTLNKEPGKTYLPETDTFDTWFSSGQWATNAYISSEHPGDVDYFYPSDSIVIGQDLLRLSVSRKIILSQYLSGRLPFRTVYLHRLILGQDGQKMSKSLGNAVSLESYIETYGADTTRMALVSYTEEKEDFILEYTRLDFFKEFCERLWTSGKVAHLVNEYSIEPFTEASLLPEDTKLIKDAEFLAREVGKAVEKYRFAYAQEKLTNFLTSLENYAGSMQEERMGTRLSVLKYVFQAYITALHPFAPFITEELQAQIYDSSQLLATA